jgi:hypothetical protein
MNEEVIRKTNELGKKVERKTRSLVKIFVNSNAENLENQYEKFCEVLFSEGGIIKGCQFTSDLNQFRDSRFCVAIYYEIETERVERFKKETESV